MAVKLLEGDEEIKASAQLSEAQRGRIRAAIAAYVERGREKHPGIDSLTLMVDARYAAIAKLSLIHISNIFNANSGIKSSTGHIYIGCNNGINKFYPCLLYTSRCV